MTMISRTLRPAAVLVGVVICVVLVSCHGGGTGPAADRVLTGVVTTVDFLVDTGERVVFRGDVIVLCDTATVLGELVAEKATADAGQNGNSIRIESKEDVVISGTIAAGNGGPGRDDSTGGNGGSVEAQSENGSIAVGGAAGAAGVTTAQRNGATLCAGDGGGGGDGLIGGAGGEGGSLALNAPNGTLTFNQQPNLLHVGDGGKGGRGVVAGNDLLTFQPPEELSNEGGDSGHLLFDCAELLGVEFQDGGTTPDGEPVQIGFFDDGVGDGGVGGDAGGFFFGIDPDTGDSTWPTAVSPAQVVSPADTDLIVTGGCNGGNGETCGGRGGDVSVNFWGAPPNEPSSDGGRATAIGGDGGHITYHSSGVLGQLMDLIYVLDLKSGRGGNAFAAGQHGTDGAPGANGGDGGWGKAFGGDGGDITAASEYPLGKMFLRSAGDAEAWGGSGGDGGAQCDPPDQGGNGGEGGGAVAGGGDCGHITVGWRPGAGGAAAAFGGRGGDGGHGKPPGTGWRGGLASTIIGYGDPEGDTFELKGEHGEDGRACSEPPPWGGTWDAVYSKTQDPYKGTCDVVHWVWPESIRTGQAGETLLGGPNNPLFAYGGQTMALKADSTRLWVSTVGNGLYMYSNPLQGGDRPPDVVLTPSGGSQADFYPRAVWHDASSDTLYCTEGVNIHAWHNASAMTFNRAADRSIEVDDLGSPSIGAIAGDGTRDILFGTARRRCFVIDGISAANGARTPDRFVEVTPGIGSGVAYDGTHDRLYGGSRDMIYGQHTVVIIDNASAASGQTDFIALSGVGLDSNVPIALAVFGDRDTLFVCVYRADLLRYNNASAIQGDIAPSWRADIPVTAFGIAPSR